MKVTKSLQPLIGLLIVLFVTLSQAVNAAQSVLYDSIIGGGVNSTSFGGNRYLAQSFASGTSVSWINQVEVKMQLSGDAGTPQMELWSNNIFDFPDTMLATLSTAETVDGMADYTFSPVTSYPLEANKQYWIVLKGDQLTADTAQFRWRFLEQTVTGTGIGFVALNAITNDAASSWITFNDSPYMMRVTISDEADPVFSTASWTWNEAFPWVYSPVDGWLYYKADANGWSIYKDSTGEWTTVEN